VKPLEIEPDLNPEYHLSMHCHVVVEDSSPRIQF